MIDFLRGKLIEHTPVSAVIECSGVGYTVSIPYSTYQLLPQDGSDIFIYTHLIHRETAMELFGFATKDEREMFRRLLSVSGIGPRTAIAILSGMPVEELIHTIRSGEYSYLTCISGVGKKTAQRLVLELKDRIGDIVVGEREIIGGVREPFGDVVAVLVALGYKEQDAMRAARAAYKANPEGSTDELVRLSLKEM